MNTALLLINFQNDYFPHGKSPVERSIEASLCAKEVLDDFRHKKMPVIHLQHVSTRPDDQLFLPCTKGMAFHPNVQPIKNEAIIKKYYPNSFKDTGLRKYLVAHQIHHLVICGMMTHLSITATTHAAYYSGYRCTVLEDACATTGLVFNHMSVSPLSVHHAILAALQPLYANVMSTKKFLGIQVESERVA